MVGAVGKEAVNDIQAANRDKRARSGYDKR
jgi:hypothetical protein